MLEVLRRLCALCVLIGASISHATQSPVMTGDWHGTLATPQGELVLIIHLDQSAASGYSGVLEVPAQAPGQKIPLHDLSLSATQLSFSVPAIAARYSGTWTDDQWSGTFHQQLEFPLVLQRGLPPPAPRVEGLDGTWTATLNRNGVELRLILRVQSDAQGTVARLDSPDMGGFNLPVTELLRDGTRISFAVPAASVRYQGQLYADPHQLEGQWLRTGQPAATVRFTRNSTDTARQAARRPQAPVPPFPYRQQEVRFDNPETTGVQLAGTLTLPPGDGPFPAAILISGSGPQDRNETVFGHQPFAVLADHLSRHGIAVLRYDDRGFAASSGDHHSATSADFASDARAAAQLLRQQPEIAADAIGFIGHSEGGMVGPLASVDNDDIAFLILLAAPGTDTTQLMESQRRLIGLSQGMSEPELERGADIMARINAAVVAAPDQVDAQSRLRALLTADALEQLGLPITQQDSAVQQFSRDWYRYFLRYDARSVLARLHLPVLALNGSLDHQVPAQENLDAIRAALSHNPDTTVSELEGLNHMFQNAPTGAFGEYPDIEETFAPSALTLISDWIRARFVKQR